MGRYDDIIGLDRPESGRYPKMERANRAKQFMPFAALRGFEETVEARQELWVSRAVLSEDDAEEIEETLQGLTRRLAAGERPEVEITRFRERGEDRGMLPEHLRWEADGSGQYEKIQGTLDRLDAALGRARVDGRWVALDEICGIRTVTARPADPPA